MIDWEPHEETLNLFAMDASSLLSEAHTLKRELDNHRHRMSDKSSLKDALNIKERQ